MSESAIYRHFGSKSGLFAAAVLDPFLTFLGTFTDASARYLSQPLDDEAMMRLFVSELLDQLTEHRRALRMVLAAAEDLDRETTAAFYGAFNDVMVKVGRGRRVRSEVAPAKVERSRCRDECPDDGGDGDGVLRPSQRLGAQSRRHRSEHGDTVCSSQLRIAFITR